MISSTGAVTGTIAAQNQSVSSNISGAYSKTAIQVTGTYTTDLTVQVTVDGTNWVSLASATAVTNVGTGTQAAVIPGAATGIFRVDSSSLMGIRVIALGLFTGSATVSISSDD